MIVFTTIAVVLTWVGRTQAFSLSMRSSSSGPHPYCVNFKCKVQVSRRDDFISLVRKNQRLTLDEEPEALQYIVGEDTEEENVFYIHEQFTSSEGFAAHRDTQRNAAWQEFKATNPFEEDGGDPTTNFYHGTHSAIKIPVRDAFCLNVQLCIKPDVRDEFLEVIENNARGSNEDEPLCLQYDWGEDTYQPNVFHFHEEYTGADAGKEGFDVHALAPHFTKWEEFAATGPFTKPPVVSFYRTL
jgi:quinol monooxygenase YgiN